MTPEAAREILEGADYFCILNSNTVSLDGRFSQQQLEAILVLMKEAK